MRAARAGEQAVPGPRTALIAAALAVLALLLAGCDIRVMTIVGADRHVKRTVSCKVPGDYVEPARIVLRKKFPRGAGWYIKELQQGGAIVFVMRNRFVKTDDDPFGPPVSVKSTVEGVKGKYVFEETFTDAPFFSTDDERQFGGPIEVLYTVRMPGRIIDTDTSATLVGGGSAGEPAIDGKEVTWRLRMTDLAPPGGVQIMVTSERWDPKKTVVYTMVAIVGLVLLYWVLVRLLVWRRIRAERLAAEREAEGPVEPDEPVEPEEPVVPEEPGPPAAPADAAEEPSPFADTT